MTFCSINFPVSLILRTDSQKPPSMRHMNPDCLALLNYPTALLSRHRSPLQVRHVERGGVEDNRTVTPFSLGMNQWEHGCRL